MRYFASILCFALMASLSLSAQETNDASASLTSHGSDPGNNPFFSSAQGSMVLEVGGASGSLFSLLVGDRAVGALCPPLLNGECLDLAVGQASIPLLIIVDGFGGSPFGMLDSSGGADFALPAAGLDGLTPAFQALVQDPTNPPININFSAACEFDISNVATFQGDDVFVEYYFPSGVSYEFYGQSFSSITVSTNGWVKFGTGCTFSDFSESTPDLLSGTIGGAPGGDPVIAVLWNDIDMGNNPSQEVRIQEVQAGSGFEVRVSWINAELFPATALGTFKVTLKSSGTVEIDHHSVNTVSGIVGLSSGENAGGTTVVSHDFYNGGFPPNAFNGAGFRNTIYRNYNVFGNEAPSSLYTLCFQPQNAFGLYDLAGVFLLQSCL